MHDPILDKSHYVVIAGFVLVIIALLEPSKILIKQLLELNLPTLGTKRSLILGFVGCVLIIIGLVGLWASCQITDYSPEIYGTYRNPDSPIIASKNGTLVTINAMVVDNSDPNISQKANNSIQKMVYSPPQFVYKFSVKNPGRNFYELKKLLETTEKSGNCTWWVFPSDAGVNQILINVAIKGENAKNTSRSEEYLVNVA
jgi:hypothetical protein